MSPDRADLAPRVVLRVSRAALLAVLVAFVGASPLALSAPSRLGWLLALPLLAAAWVLRVRTVADVDGVSVRAALRTRRIGWDELRGVRFHRGGWGRAVLRDGSAVTLPAVGFNDLRQLAAVSGGRLPDPFAAAAQARRPAASTAEPDEPGSPTERE